MFTLNELIHILKENYTSEELVDFLEITPEMLTTEFAGIIEEKSEELEEMVKEDLGYDSEQ